MTSPLPHAEHRIDQTPRVVLTHINGSRAEIHRYGAHLTSWIDASGRENFFLSPLAGYSDGVSIRGGIPIVFPQFASTGPLPKHGLVRTRVWDIKEQSTSSVTFRITDDSATRALWPYEFLAELHVALDDTLTVTLRITNTGESPFSFTSAFHNYFHVDDVHAASVKGLTGCGYSDKVLNAGEVVDTAPAVHIEGETDRVYVDGPREVSIARTENDRSLHVTATGFGDWVIWNPGAELTRTLTDMEPEGYRQMLCVEAALVREPKTLAPGAQWTGTQVVSAR